jgi:hypothetical protein
MPAANKRTLPATELSTPPTSPTNVKRIKVTFSSTDEALKEFNNECQLETFAHWWKKESPQLIGSAGSRGRYNFRFAKKQTFMIVGMVLDHDVNIKKEVLLP